MSSYTPHMSLTVCVGRVHFGLDMLKLHKDLQNVSVLAAHLQVCTGCRV